MRRLLGVLCVLALPLSASAQEEDDPAFARKPQPAAEEPSPDPVPYTDEDPGLAPPGPPKPGADLTMRAKRPAAPPDDDELGIGFRVSYKTVLIPEAAAAPQAGFTQEFKEDRFHGLTIDVYPISWYARVGLATQLAIETEDNDWLATEGLTLGGQKPMGKWTPFIEGGLHVGLARRTFWVFDSRIGPHDSLTLLWAFTGELGVDAKLTGKALGTVSLGVQRTSFFYTTGDNDNKLLIKNDVALALKVGIGY